MKNSRWQFSLRSLHIVTTFLSVCLAIGVHFAGAIVVGVAFGTMQAAMLLAADWLIRPANRHALAFATATSWILLGSGLMALAGRDVY